MGKTLKKALLIADHLLLLLMSVVCGILALSANNLFYTVVMSLACGYFFNEAVHVYKLLKK